MSRRRIVPVLIILMAIAWPAAAQDSASADPSAAAATAPKKKGMFGKLKSIAGNKTVQSVAKVAACTMVPGGQFVAGAIDAASHPDAGGIASGVAGGATGSACGMSGIAGGVGGAAAGAGMAVVPGMGNVAGLGGAAGASANTAAAVASAASMTAAMFAKPGAGGQPDASGALSAKDEKKMRSTLKKQGMTDEQVEATMVSYHQQNQSQPSAPSEGSRFGGQQNLPATAPGAAPAAQPVGLPDDYEVQLKAGKLVLIDLPWKGATADLIAGTEDGVKVSFVKIAESLNQTTGTYHVDVYVTEIDKSVATARAAAVVVFLTNAGLPAEQKLGGKAITMTKSKQSRVEIVRN